MNAAEMIPIASAASRRELRFLDGRPIELTAEPIRDSWSIAYEG
jgi:hypothetical protein